MSMHPTAFPIAAHATRLALTGAHATDPVLPDTPRRTRAARRRRA